MKKYALALTMAAGAILPAADVSGSVSAAKGLHLNGQAVPVAGTKSWPVGAGDELKSEAAPVVLTMKDGSKIVLGKNSTAKVEAGTVRLMTGTMQYELSRKSSLQVAVKQDVLQARTGVASTSVGVPAAAPIVTSVAATEELPPVSRRKP